MNMEPRSGRPHKFGEPTIRREFRFPETLNTRLTEYSRQNGEDVSDVVRSAVEDRLNNTQAQGITTPFVEPGENWAEEIRKKVIEALREERERDSLLVRLRDPDRERLEAVAEAIGYTEPADLVEDVMRTLLRRPEEISEMLLGQGLRAIQQALEAEGQHEAAAAGRAEQEKLQKRISKIEPTSEKKTNRKAA